MKGAIALAIVGAALLAVAGSQPWWVVKVDASMGNPFSSNNAVTTEYSLNDMCSNQSYGYPGYYGGCTSYAFGGPYGVAGVSRGANAALGLAFALALAQAALIGVAALWPRLLPLARWAGFIAVSSAAIGFAAFTIFIPGKAADAYPDEWKMNLFFGSGATNAVAGWWGAGIGWYLAFIALVVLSIAALKTGQVGRYLAGFRPVPLKTLLETPAPGYRPWPPSMTSPGPSGSPAQGPAAAGPPAGVQTTCANCRAGLNGPICAACGYRNW